jgi:hypothetical protein
MTLGIVVFGAAFLVGLGLGTYTRRPLSTAFFVVGCFTALLMLSATGEIYGAAAVVAIVFLVGLVVESVRETFAILVGRY